MNEELQALRNRIKTALGEDWEPWETMTEAIQRLRKERDYLKRQKAHHWYPEEQDPDGKTDVRWRCSDCQDLRYSIEEPAPGKCEGAVCRYCGGTGCECPADAYS
jgi:hypothetical protein